MLLAGPSGVLAERAGHSAIVGEEAMNASMLVRCFDCGTEVPLDQTVEMEWHGPEQWRQAVLGSGGFTEIGGDGDGA